MMRRTSYIAAWMVLLAIYGAACGEGGDDIAVVTSVSPQATKRPPSSTDETRNWGARILTPDGRHKAHGIVVEEIALADGRYLYGVLTTTVRAIDRDVQAKLPNDLRVEQPGVVSLTWGQSVPYAAQSIRILDTATEGEIVTPVALVTITTSIPAPYEYAPPKIVTERRFFGSTPYLATHSQIIGRRGLNGAMRLSETMQVTEWTDTLADPPDAKSSAFEGSLWSIREVFSDLEIWRQPQAYVGAFYLMPSGEVDGLLYWSYAEDEGPTLNVNIRLANLAASGILQREMMQVAAAHQGPSRQVPASPRAAAPSTSGTAIQLKSFDQPCGANQIDDCDRAQGLACVGLSLNGSTEAQHVCATSCTGACPQGSRCIGTGSRFCFSLARLGISNDRPAAPAKAPSPAPAQPQITGCKGSQDCNGGLCRAEPNDKGQIIGRCSVGRSVLFGQSCTPIGFDGQFPCDGGRCVYDGFAVVNGARKTIYRCEQHK